MRSKTCSLLSLAVVTLTVGGIWLPEILHYRVPTPHFSAAIMERSRSEPVDARLVHLSKVPFDFPILDPAAPAVRADAELVLQGQWNSPEFGIMNFTWPFSTSDLSTGLESQKLHFAALDHVDLLLVGYEALGDRRYLKGARDIVNAWARYERRAIFGRGYIWNDHAMAQRLLVLARYWNYVRHSPLADPDSVQLLLQFVDRTAHIIAKPGQFTARTNHGLMQNLALLHVAASFPGLPDSGRFRDIAVERLRMQFGYYQSPEGVVLEHSTGYHRLGVRVLHGLQSYAPEVGEEFEREVARRLADGCRYLLAMQRPDQSLPAIGNTKSGPLDSPCPKAADTRQGGLTIDLYPVSGFAALRYRHAAAGGTDTYSHTAVTWSNFATGAHKHDDELSIVTWSRGLPLLTGTGYWVFGESRERAANGWRGANGPFLESEARTSARSAELRWQGTAADLAFLQMTRTNRQPAGQIERQLLTLGPDIWLTIDGTDRSSGAQHAVWTLFPGWTVTAGAQNGNYVASFADTTAPVSASFAAAGQPLAFQLLHASNQPFGGWVALANTPALIKEAWSIQVDGDAASPIASLWSRDANLGPGKVSWKHWRAADDWSTCLDGLDCHWQVTRAGNRVSVDRAGRSTVLDLTAVAPQEAAREAINQNYRDAVRRYPYWRDLVDWRLYATVLTLAGWLLSELVLLLSRRLLAERRPGLHYVELLHTAMPVIWTLVGVAIVFLYF